MASDERAYARWLIPLAIVLVAFNFRTPITSLSPVLGVIQSDLGLGYAATSLLTAIPTLCFGVFAFAAAPLGRRVGRDTGVLVGVAVLALGLLLRVRGGTAWVLFATTVLVGAGIAVSQTLLPSIISEHFAERAGFATGLYTTALVIGAGVASGVTPALSEFFGSWPLALAAWAVPALAAGLVWLPVAAGNNDGSDAGDADEGAPDRGGRERLPWRSRKAWLLTVFFGLQSLLFYTTVTWLAPRYVAFGWSTNRAGLLVTVLFVGQLGGTFGLAPLSDRRPDRRPWLALTVVCCGVGFLALAFAPLALPWVSALVLGVGLGGVFALAMTLPVDVTADPGGANRVTAMMTGAGYLLASPGPFVGGVLRDVTGSNRAIFVLLFAVSVVLLVLTARLDPSGAE